MTEKTFTATVYLRVADKTMVVRKVARATHVDDGVMFERVSGSRAFFFKNDISGYDLSHD